jgi:hypothetical protein
MLYCVCVSPLRLSIAAPPPTALLRMTGLTHRLRRRAERVSTLRAWEMACSEANRTYVTWSAEPTREHYSAYLAADARAARARQFIGQGEIAARRTRRRLGDR